MFFNKNKYLIFHLASKNNLELKRFVSRSKNKDKARKTIINLKYKLSTLSPLLFKVVSIHSVMINQLFVAESSGTYIGFDDSESHYMINIFIFKCLNFRITAARRDREWGKGPQIYIYENERRIGRTLIKTSRFENNLMKLLIKFNVENATAVSNFVRDKKEYDIRNLNNV